ncbi:hypothetical protein V8F06_009691 [Rhypophila decipiens]
MPETVPITAANISISQSVLSTEPRPKPRLVVPPSVAGQASLSPSACHLDASITSAPGSKAGLPYCHTLPGTPHVYWSLAHTVGPGQPPGHTQPSQVSHSVPCSLPSRSIIRHSGASSISISTCSVHVSGGCCRSSPPCPWGCSPSPVSRFPLSIICLWRHTSELCLSQDIPNPPKQVRTCMILDRWAETVDGVEYHPISSIALKLINAVLYLICSLHVYRSPCPSVILNLFCLRQPRAPYRHICNASSGPATPPCPSPDLAAVRFNLPVEIRTEPVLYPLTRTRRLSSILISPSTLSHHLAGESSEDVVCISSRQKSSRSLLRK